MKLYVVDTNVILIASQLVRNVPEEQLICYKGCIQFIQDFIKHKDKVLLDREGRVLKEYHRKAFKISDYPNMATMLIQTALEGNCEYLSIGESNENQYNLYPSLASLKEFDPPDRIFIALAYNHDRKPPIVEASDSKWWGIKDDLAKCGMEVIFIDEDYIRKKYEKKMG